MSNKTEVGDTTRLTVNVTDGITQAAFDPTNPKFVIIDPDAVKTEFTFPTDTEVINPQVGEYYIDYTWTASGTWTWGMVVTGPPDAVESETIYIGSSPLL